MSENKIHSINSQGSGNAEFNHWTGKFNCPKEELLQARNAVRISTEKVAEYMRKEKSKVY
jgi:hypothetical protein